MLNSLKATAIVRENLPDGRIRKFVETDDLYIFQVFTDDELEGEMDPFYSVDKETGEFSWFSLLESEDSDLIFNLFAARG